ncbi:alpha/beta hydrolase [Actinoalloteichus sp. AHMU CJ021]|uniref:alpha/beta hydrolase n=1 Tax=Actinoalloteichus sp. AHMU CJ021 TaxID=2072503 RepID=UPI00307BC5A5
MDYLTALEDDMVPPPVSDDVLTAYDLVAVDIRGSGHSTPTVTCFDDDQEAVEFARSIPTVPTTEAERQARAAADAEYARRCRDRSGELLDHMSSTAIARDLDMLRTALGEDRLDYLGQSYGTFLGAVYAALFPERTGRLVLDGVLSPLSRDTGEPETTPSSRVGFDLATRETLEEFFRQCVAAGERCAFGGGDPAKAFDRIVDRLDEGGVPLTTSDGAEVTLTYSYFLTWTGQWLYQPIVWNAPGGASFLNAVEQALAAPDGPNAAALAEEIKTNQDAGLMVAPYAGLNPVYHAVTCLDTDHPSTVDALADHVAAREREVPHFAALRAWQTSPCSHWQAGTNERYEGPWDTRTDEPVLLVSSEFDPATPVWSARGLHETLPRSTLLISEGAGHIAAQQSTCVVRAISEYLVEGDSPAEGATCAREGDPFAPS